ncbi:vanadium-dependent haloperoxidase [Microlunatus parietis]|uniref:PAP2 superfamily protein n=1 Tax=Microlunatus parietis TaxID=682979 RepID=A0A7Y9I9Z6_9ACTN|nr:vanadium-dependent haloperoxidase [Microlunatus parietis]NYE72711.1 hypothetical protein [Microlunatus parietis]
MKSENHRARGTAGRVSRRLFLAGAAAAGTAIAGTRTAEAAPNSAGLVRKWNDLLLEAARRGTLGPPVLARAFALVHTAIYDAWAAYDAVAHGTRYGGELRRPIAERTESHVVAAISYAAHTAAVDLFGWHAPRFDAFLRELGYDPEHHPADSSPAGIGRRAAVALLEYRHGDGSNQLNDYADTTGYRPANAPMVAAKEIDPDSVIDRNRWQPLTYPDRAGRLKTPPWAAPHWFQVEPFAKPPVGYGRELPGPARWGTAEFTRQCQELMDLTARLTPRQKAIAEYYADGPMTEAPPGHWLKFTQFVSRRDRNSLDQDVKLFFLTANALFDASIACWGLKREYDSVRPITAIRLMCRGLKVKTWNGVIDGGQWLPYQPTWFPTPPFGEYPSGHSTFSSAAAEVLQRFTGSDRFGYSSTFLAGKSLVEPGIGPDTDVVLGCPTFSEAAAQCGLSRRYGGIHFRAGDLDGRRLGREVGAVVWEKAQQYFNGQTTPAERKGLFDGLLDLDLPLGLTLRGTL